MSEENNFNFASSLDAVSIAAGRASSGVDKVMQVMDGFYDNLILWERAWENWENKTFDIRSLEIKKQSNLGSISSREEADMWKELTDASKYGWQNVWVAEENYYKKMYEHSKQWIEDQTRLGTLSAEEIAEAWQRVYDKFDNLNYKYEAAANIRKVLLAEGEAEVEGRRGDSDRYMNRQDLRDGGDYNRQFEDYSRRIESEMALLKEIESGRFNGVALGAEEQKQKWLEVYEYIEDLQDLQYQSSKKYLDKQISDYINACSIKLQQEYKLQQEKYTKELKDIDKKYDMIERLQREEERDDKLSELRKSRSYYEDAVTKEGQEKLKDINEQIKSIEDAQRKDDRDLSRQTEIDNIENKIEYAKKRYERSMADLESLKAKMLGVSRDITNQSAASAISAGDSIKNIALALTSSVEEMFVSSETRLIEYAARVSSLLGSSSLQGGPRNNSNLNFTLNDYGNKTLSNNDAVASYADELLNWFKNSIRNLGVK